MLMASCEWSSNTSDSMLTSIPAQHQTLDLAAITTISE